jgi:peroxiredoxin
MKHPLSSMLAVAMLSLCTTALGFAQKVGDQAPNFQAKDSTGHTQSLDQYRGKFVVLEWTNRDCPYTKKQYASGNMQKLQKEWKAKGVVWLTVLSSAAGQEGFLTAAQENSWMQKIGADPHAAILDPSGALGHMYDAKTTPDMYVVNPQGKLVYSGAIDSKPTTDVSDVKGAHNYVSSALEDAMAGKTVQPDYTRPYGCSVKYGE